MSANEPGSAVPRVSCIMVFLFFICSCSSAAYVRIRLFLGLTSSSSCWGHGKGNSARQQTFVTYQFDVRVRCLWFMFNVAQVKCVIRVSKNISSAQCAGKDLLEAVHDSPVVAVCNASRAPFEDGNSFREHGFKASILLRQHRSIAAPVQQTRSSPMLLSNLRRCAQDVGFTWALQCSNSYSHVGRYNWPDLKSSM